jgi:TldD protein
MTPDMIGRRIAKEFVNVVDDPAVPGSAGYFLFDDEGVRARRKYLIKDGIMNEFLHNRETAVSFGIKSNGSARAMDYESEPIVRMSNTFLLPGELSEEEIIEDVKFGVYMKSFMEWNIDDRRMNERYVGSEAYLIEKGEITHPVKRPVLETTTLDFFSAIEAVGDKVGYNAGTCGKGEPEQGVPVWMGGPAAKLKGIRLG